MRYSLIDLSDIRSGFLPSSAVVALGGDGRCGVAWGGLRWWLSGCRSASSASSGLCMSGFLR